ncbi:hypothetical protein NOF04DRAFT_19519 [Fusarium oxysporum II5]|uniref:Uncharacterized protein n=2 Tax=Fusarium oxysporum species complex TaxID=171631 RepID=X0IP88_FUSO5|nr:uncharacterized protein FOIG_16059 [Fusarium odoratissimum NRRL 54006]EXL90682.1 hypothetical protein FOIG_16059 [Fusarium odoratissimum NRRL 54006]KAK2132310.1 hypothetical protein NOF04DRAFT_19519 [Fusarium oxysporum II5]TXC08498.1 hypothetical protein FocTR4_00002435 [Fusarium oxysporum f. sp. cubense]
MEGHQLQPSERIPAIQEFFARWIPQIHPVKSPEEEFQDNIKGSQDQFNSLTNSSQNSFEKLDEILRCGARIKELMALHQDTKEQKEHEYQQKLLDQQISSLFEHIDLFGPELGKRLCNDWCDRVDHPLSTTTAQSDTIPGAVDTHQPEDTTASCSAPIQEQEPLTQPTSTREPPAQSTNDSIPSPPNTENACEPTTRPDELHRTRQNTSSGPQKRPVDFSGSPESHPTRPTKRVRSDVTQGPLTGDRTIEFERVYQNGQAEPKYVIIKHNRFWYILECKKHRLHFNNHPIRGAVKHLQGKKHNQTSVNFEEAIRALGTRVLHCDENGVAENNEVARRLSYSQMCRPADSLSSSFAHSLSTRSNQNVTQIDPQPGEVYTTFWSETKQFFAILVLPWRNAGQLGKDMSLTVQDTALIRKVPSCYQYNHVDESFEWAPDYRPYSQDYSKRKYPIMYFDASVFPGECRVNWVAAREFQLYDPQVATIPFKGIVDGFIASRNKSGNEAVPHTDDRPTAEIFPREEQLTGVPGREIIVIDDDNDDETAGHEPWPDTPVGSPLPKTEPQEEPMTAGNAQQDISTGTNHSNAFSQQPLKAGVANHSQCPTNENADSHDNLIHPAEFPRPLDNASQTDPMLLNPDHARQLDVMSEAQVPTGAASSNPLFDMQPQATAVADAPLSRWPPELSAEEHEPSPIDNTNFHSHLPPQPAATDTRPPEAIMTPLHCNQNPPDNSQSQPAQTTGLYGYFSQARSASSQCRLDSDGRLKWIAPKTISGMARKQMSMGARQH